MNSKSFGKTIRLFLIDGFPQRRMSCELSNWVGKAYKIPRTMIKDSIDREELNSTGVYMLLGKDPDSPDKDMVYIGEAEKILDRLRQHLDKKEFWNEAIIIFSKDENLNKAHAKYLECRLHELAQKAGRFKVENSQLPSTTSLSEADTSEMEEFLENTKLIVNTLGYKVFESIKPIGQKESKGFAILAARGAKAIGQPTSEGFVVFAGSRIAKDTVPSAQKWIVDLRKKIFEEGAISEKNEESVFSKDYLFSSPSAAAAVIMGRSANGLTEWKLKDGTTLKKFETKSAN